MSQAEELLNAVAEDTMTGITWDGVISGDSVYITDNSNLKYYLVSKEIPKRHTYAAGVTIIMLDREWTVYPIDSTKFGDNAYELMYTYDGGATKLLAIVLTEEYYDEDTAISYPAGTYFHRLNDSTYVTFLQTFAIDGANSGLVSNDDDPHIVIGQDKIVTVPESLKKIAVQHDHNIETVTFDCPRYWDGIDFATSNTPPSGKYSWDGDILGREGFYRKKLDSYVQFEYFYKVSSETPDASVFDADEDGNRYSCVFMNSDGDATSFSGDSINIIAGGYELWWPEVSPNVQPHAIIITSEENDYGVSTGVYFGWMADSDQFVVYTSSIAPAVPVTGVATIVNDFAIYINYMLPGSGELGSYVAKNLRVDADDPELIHFDWTISSNVTKDIGAITFLVCAKKVGVDGTVLHKWNSELCRDLRVSEGLETVETIMETQPDFITQVLTTLDRFNQSEYGQVVARIEKLEGAVNPGEDDVNIAGRLTTAESDINTLEEGMRSVNGSLVTLEGRADAAESDIDANTQDIAALGTRMTTAETNIGDVKTRMGTAESEIDALQEIANRQLRETTWTSLWSNSSPRSTFGSQTLFSNGTLLTAGYDMLCIICRYSVDYSYTQTAFLMITTSEDSHAIAHFPAFVNTATGSSNQTSSKNGCSRHFQYVYTSGTLEVGQGFYETYENGSAGTIDTGTDRYCIPVAIYGIKW